MTKPKLEDLLDCIVNQTMVEEVIDFLFKGYCLKESPIFLCICLSFSKQYVKLPGRKYLGDKGKTLAAIKIQSIVRRFVRYREYQRIKHTIVRVRIIQQAMRLYLNKLHTQQKIKKHNEH